MGLKLVNIGGWWIAFGGWYMVDGGIWNLETGFEKHINWLIWIANYASCSSRTGYMRAYTGSTEVISITGIRYTAAIMARTKRVFSDMSSEWLMVFSRWLRVDYSRVKMIGNRQRTRTSEPSQFPAFHFGML